MESGYIEGFTGEFLHINEVFENKLIDLEAGGGTGTLILSHECESLSSYALKVIAERIGKTGNTALLNSALSGSEQHVNRLNNVFSWRDMVCGTDVRALHAFITAAKKELVLRGNNPLFLSVGALKWRVSVKEKGRELLKDVISPLLIFPIKLVVTANSSPVSIEFIDDEIYLNPCLIAKLAQICGQEIADGLPSPGGKPQDDAVNIADIDEGYLDRVAEYVKSCKMSEDTVFDFNKDLVAIAQYKHSELCTYYDVRRNRDKIYAHPQIRKMYTSSHAAAEEVVEREYPTFVLPRDSVQERIISKIINGQSMIIKGPPGTGKTVTIANAVAALLAQNKKVIFASKKISALAEVYAKLPEPLRRFTMLLDSETEQNAAKISPEEVKQDLKRILKDKKEYKADSSLESEIRHVAAERADVVQALSAYVDIMFNATDVAGGSFYRALDCFLKNDLPIVEFAEEDELGGVTAEQYNTMLSLVDGAQKHFERLTDGGAHPVYYCPWFGIKLSSDTEKAVQSFKEQSALALSVTKKLEGCTDGVNTDEVTLAHVAGIAGSALQDGAVEKLVSGGVNMQELESCYIAYLSCKDIEELELPSTDGIGERVAALKQYEILGPLTLKSLDIITRFAGLFRELNADQCGIVLKAAESVKNTDARAKEYLSAARSVFKEELTAEQQKAILSAPLSKYAETSAKKPKAMDFKAKKAYKELCGLSYVTAPAFNEVVAATEAYKRYCAELAGKDKFIEEHIFRTFKKRLSDEELECVYAAAEVCKNGIKITDLLDVVDKGGAYVLECGGNLLNTRPEVTVEGLIGAYVRAYSLKKLVAALDNINKTAPVYTEEDMGKEGEIALGVLSVAAFTKACKNAGAAAASIKAIRALGGGLKEEIEKLVALFKEFGESNFKNYFSVNAEDSAVAALAVLAADCTNRDKLAAAAGYAEIKSSDSPLDIAQFLYYFESNPSVKLSFKDVFEHSFYHLAIRKRHSIMGLYRNGMGDRVEGLLDKFDELEKRTAELNVKKIEERCFSRIDADDKDFLFVQDRNPGENLRLMFKRHAKGLLKLKRCMILSPYTASLLFGESDYEDFDVLIIDEASQLEPALALPVLFRSKQCVIVGDEWQMPPIKHFVTLSPYQDGEEGYGALEPEISALGLALRSESFPVEELVCHYRSKTETLIRYSQKMFYPNVRTFPAPVPARLPSKNVEGLGLRDAYVEGGFVESGKNDAEADRVVEELKAHFDNYFDPSTNKLSMSVGVVAFGQSQCDLIEAKVARDKTLSGKIQKALEHFDDLPEKLVFFKTIETVQGQECGHLILSITHGKRISGPYMHFGQLNQGKLGRCIFNVAVTRAQYMVTVVHSIKAAEITSDNVSYIREYLETVERFNGVGEGQFVSRGYDSGFINSVVEYVHSLGIDRERIVTGYGITEGSVRIPVVILSKDKQTALIGIWCEVPTGNRYDYIDYNVRYRNTLIGCGWKIYQVSIHDWMDNSEKEKKALAQAIKNVID